MKLYKSDSIEGYETNEVQEYMKNKGLLSEWQNWSMGSTGAIIDGKFIVYKWDVDRFLQGKPNID